MTRAELIRRFVLNSFCDFDEDIEQITKWTVHNGSACGLTITRDEIIQALRELIESGYARAWDAEPRKPAPPAEYPEMPGTEEITADTSFGGTPDGRQYYESRQLQPPFYWNGKLHQDWTPPDASLPRAELIRLLVLASIWEPHVVLEFIQMRMDDLAIRLGTTFSRDEIISALGELISLGYAKAWLLDRGDPPREYDGMPPVEDITPYRAYFWMAPEGLSYHRSDDSWWPFEDNDDGELILRKDWTPPNA
jgi:hypothetical protein